MSDTTETVSLRDALANAIVRVVTTPSASGGWGTQAADDILDLLRAHRNETLEALGGTEARANLDGDPITCIGGGSAVDHRDLHLAGAHCDEEPRCMSAWVFREASE